MFMELYLLCSLVMVLLSRAVADGLMIGLPVFEDDMDGVMGLDGCIPGRFVVPDRLDVGLEMPFLEPPFEPCIMLDEEETPGLLIPIVDELFAVVRDTVLARDAVLLVPVAIFLVVLVGLAIFLAAVVLALEAVTFLEVIGFLAETVRLIELPLFAMLLEGVDLLAVFALEATRFTALLMVPDAVFLADVVLLMPEAVLLMPDAVLPVAVLIAVFLPDVVLEEAVLLAAFLVEDIDLPDVVLEDTLLPDVVLDADVVLPEAVRVEPDAVLRADEDLLAFLAGVLDVPLPVLFTLELNVRAKA